MKPNYKTIAAVLAIASVLAAGSAQANPTASYYSYMNNTGGYIDAKAFTGLECTGACQNYSVGVEAAITEDGWAVWTGNTSTDTDSFVEVGTTNQVPVQENKFYYLTAWHDAHADWYHFREMTSAVLDTRP